MFQGSHRRHKLLNQAPGGAGYNASSPSDGDLLVYDTPTDKWVFTQTLDGAYTFSGVNTFDGTTIFTTVGKAAQAAGLEMRSASTWQRFTETDQSADESEWVWGVSSKIFRLITQTDLFADGVSAIRVIRGTGTAVAEIELNATTIDVNATANISGQLVLQRNSVRGSAAINISTDTHAAIYFQAGGATTDEKNWAMDALSTGQWRLGTSTDADGTGNYAITIDRAAAVVTNLTLAVGSGKWRLQHESLADGATGTFTLAADGTIHISCASGSANAIFTNDGQTAVSVFAGSNSALGTSGTNPDTDGKANYWMSAASVLSIKNRLGSTRDFSVMALNIN